MKGIKDLSGRIQAFADAIEQQRTGQQTDVPHFKTGTQTVPLFAAVTDATGRLIPDLVKEDYEIFKISIAACRCTGTTTPRRAIVRLRGDETLLRTGETLLRTDKTLLRHRQSHSAQGRLRLRTSGPSLLK